jgi:hypothetical protein
MRKTSRKFNRIIVIRLPIWQADFGISVLRSRKPVEKGNMDTHKADKEYKTRRQKYA